MYSFYVRPTILWDISCEGTDVKQALSLSLQSSEELLEYKPYERRTFVKYGVYIWVGYFIGSLCVSLCVQRMMTELYD